MGHPMGILPYVVAPKMQITSFSGVTLPTLFGVVLRTTSKLVGTLLVWGDVVHILLSFHGKTRKKKSHAHGCCLLGSLVDLQ